jgi:putative transposase
MVPDVRDLMMAAVEHRFGRVNRLPFAIEWLSDNGSSYIAGDTRSFARDIGLEPRTTPIESPQSNGMAEAFVRTIKRDSVRVCPRPFGWLLTWRRGAKNQTRFLGYCIAAD